MGATVTAGQSVLQGNAGLGAGRTVGRQAGKHAQDQRWDQERGTSVRRPPRGESSCLGPCLLCLWQVIEASQVVHRSNVAGNALGHAAPARGEMDGGADCAWGERGGGGGVWGGWGVGGEGGGK